MSHQAAPPQHPPRGGLRIELLLAFLPLAAALFGAGLLAMLHVQRLHTDVLRMFEENREVALVRSVSRELTGVSDWLQRPGIDQPSVRELVAADVRQHMERAAASIAMLSEGGRDPSRPEHQTEEATLQQGLAAAIVALNDEFARRGPAAELLPGLQRLQTSVQVLLAEVEAEHQKVGLDLDQRSSDMGRLVLLLAGCSALTLGALLLWFVRRVLLPLRLLDRGAALLAQGQLAARLPVRSSNELGQLAGAFNAMAARLQAEHDELERRVETRSRELLRTARLAELGTIAAGIAHEINNPLASIVACTDGLRRDHAEGRSDAARTDEYLAIIGKEAMRAQGITASMLRLAHPQQGRHEPVWLQQEIDELLRLFAHQARQAQVSISARVDPAAPAALGDAGALRQVILNLLRNALEASPRGGAIRLAVAPCTAGVAITVADQGPGVPAADADRIFEPFFTTKAPGAGTGLGLSIVHRIVQDHGGRIEVAAGPDGGAAFRVELPAV